MLHKVIKKQMNEESCFICGFKNPAGLFAQYYEMDDGKLVCLATGKSEHQSYPDRMHGGIISALLDEAAGRVLWIYEDCFAVTAELTVRFKKPVPLGEQLKIVTERTFDSKRLYKAKGEMFSASGELLATCEGSFMKVDMGAAPSSERGQKTFKSDVIEIDY